MSDLEKLRVDGDSKYNSSLDILQRINRLIEFAETSSFHNDLYGLTNWRNALSALAREVMPYCSPKERDELKAMSVAPLPHGGTVQRYHIRVNEQQIRGQLENWEYRIRELLAAKGMGLKSGNDPRRAL